MYRTVSEPTCLPAGAGPDVMAGVMESRSLPLPFLLFLFTTSVRPSLLLSPFLDHASPTNKQ